MHKFKILKKEEGQRFDIYLTGKNPKYSRAMIQKLIKSGGALVNGKTETPHYSLKEDDTIGFEIKKTVNINNADKKEEISEKKKLDVEVIAETDDYVVINKPTGLIVHPSEQSKEKTLVDYMLEKYPEIKKVGEDPLRPGIVHRLDKDVSGLMVIARNQKSFESLKKQFKDRKINKEYVGLVYGKTAKDNDEINFPIERAANGFKMAALPFTKKGEKNEDGREAISEFSVIKRFVHFTLLKIKIKTGRTHQIRAHMSAYGYPLVGDDLYGNKKTKVFNKKHALNRVFLMSEKLCFKNLNKEKKCFEIRLPEDLEIFLTKIK